jgi:hypothetical protein
MHGEPRAGAVELENKEMDLRVQRAQLYTKEKAVNDT